MISITDFDEIPFFDNIDTNFNIIETSNPIICDIANLDLIDTDIYFGDKVLELDNNYVVGALLSDIGETDMVEKKGLMLELLKSPFFVIELLNRQDDLVLNIYKRVIIHIRKKLEHFLNSINTIHIIHITIILQLIHIIKKMYFYSFVSFKEQHISVKTNLSKTSPPIIFS